MQIRNLKKLTFITLLKVTSSLEPEKAEPNALLYARQNTIVTHHPEHGYFTTDIRPATVTDGTNSVRSYVHDYDGHDNDHDHYWGTYTGDYRGGYSGSVSAGSPVVSSTTVSRYHDDDPYDDHDDSYDSDDFDDHSYDDHDDSYDSDDFDDHSYDDHDDSYDSDDFDDHSYDDHDDSYDSDDFDDHSFDSDDYDDHDDSYDSDDYDDRHTGTRTSRHDVTYTYYSTDSTGRVITHTSTRRFDRTTTDTRTVDTRDATTDRRDRTSSDTRSSTSRRSRSTGLATNTKGAAATLKVPMLFRAVADLLL